MLGVRRFLFRFGFAYWISFCAQFLVAPGLGWLGSLIEAADKRLCTWVAHLLHFELHLHPTGSGDTLYDWTRLGSYLALSLLVAIAWSVTDRREHPRLKQVLRIVIRYGLGFTMLSYGIIKLFGGQFPPPGASRLLTTYGDSSPMGLLWTFMGFSKPYVIFSGAAETLGAMLVLFRRTTTLGALILFGVLSNIVALNFLYDVPVKIYSTHYLLMCVYLLLPEARRLADLFLFNRAVAPADQALLLPRRWMRVTRVLVKVALIGAQIGGNLYGSAAEWKAPATPRYVDGLWNVTRFVKNGEAVPALIDDATRWRRLKLETWDEVTYLRWHFMPPGKMSQLFKVVVTDHELTATGEDNPPSKHIFAFTRVDQNHFHLDGSVGADRLAVDLERLEVKNTPLMSRGFHWISEDPYNR